MSLRIRRGTDAQRSGITFDMGEIVYTTDGQQLYVGDGLTQGGLPVIGANVAGFGLAYDPTTRRLEVAGLSADNIANGVNNKFFTAQLAQDAAASLFVTGTHSNISFVYDETLDKINATVTLDGVGLTDIVADTTPQLGGDLDLNLNDITGTGNINIIGSITATSLITGSITPSAVFTSIVDSGNNGLEIKTNSQDAVRVIGTTDGISIFAFASVSVSNGTVAVPTNTAAGNILGGYRIEGWYQNSYKFASGIIAAWSSNADFTTAVPAATMTFVVGDNSDGSTLKTASFNHLGNFTAPAITPGVYATTGARDAALPLPTEGMMVYITASYSLQCYSNSVWKTVTLV